MSPVPDDEMRLLSTPQAKELSELHLLQHDLDHCVKCFRLLVDHYGDREFSEAENLTRLALYRDAVIHFVTCFDRSAPLFLNVADVYPGDGNAQPYFNSLKDIRDSYIAHRHGPSRQCAIGVIAGPNGALGTGHLVVMRHVPSVLDLKHHHDFVLKARRHVEGRIEALNKIVTASAMEMTRDQILALPGAHGYNIRDGELKLGRERFVTMRAAQDSERDPNVTK